MRVPASQNDSHDIFWEVVMYGEPKDAAMTVRFQLPAIESVDVGVVFDGFGWFNLRDRAGGDRIVPVEVCVLPVKLDPVSGRRLQHRGARQPFPKHLWIADRRPHPIYGMVETSLKSQCHPIAGHVNGSRVAIVLSHESVLIIQKGFEVVELACPEMAIRVEPGVDFGEPSSIQAVHAPPAHPAHLDKLRVTQNAKMPRYRGLADVERANKIIDRTLILGQEVEDVASSRVGQDGEQIAHF